MPVPRNGARALSRTPTKSCVQNMCRHTLSDGRLIYFHAKYLRDRIDTFVIIFIINSFKLNFGQQDCSLSSVITRVSVVLKGTVGNSDRRFDNLTGNHLQSQSDIVSSVTLTLKMT